MKKITQNSLKLALLLSFALGASHSNAADTATNLTIYGNSPQMWNMPYYYGAQNIEGYAIINYAKQATFANGLNAVNVFDVPDEVDPSSIMIKNMNRNLQVVEQNFISARLNTSDVIKRSIGKDVEVEKYGADGVVTTKGTLLDASDGLIIKDGDKIRVIKDYSAISVIDSANQASGNSIKWLINSAVAGDSLFEYAFKTQGVSWSASYDVYLNGSGDDLMAKIEGWANLINNTKTSVKDTNLKLIAGETSQAGGGGRAIPMMAKAMAMDSVAGAAMESAPMSEQKFSDYHMYTVERKINLPAQSSKKVKLFADKEGVLVNRKYIFDGASSGDNAVKSVITFTNNEKSHLGLPMPGGKYRVFQKDKSGVFEQVGEATQSHKAEEEKIDLTIGNSFDLRADRKQMDEEQDQIRHRGKYTVQVALSNASSEDVEILVREPIYQQNWDIISKTHPFTKTNSNLVEFKVPVKAKSKTTMEYILQYSW